jgi:Predicted flavin-nucleotide-binding protein
MTKTLVLFESKTGFTKKIAEEVSLILGPARCAALSDAEKLVKDYEIVVLCISVNAESLEKGTLELISKSADLLRAKKLFILYLSQCGCIEAQCLNPLKEILGQSILFSEIIDCDNFDKEKFVGLVLDMKQIKEQDVKVLDMDRLKTLAEDFIKDHNTCSLSTGFGNKVRATPIEYSYKDEALYILSEGGEKFANILLNPSVSVGIFDNYKSMAQLGGMQISGRAELVNKGSEEYRSVLELKKLKYDQIMSLPIVLNMIKIQIYKIEFLWSGFREFNCDTKQILILNK